MEKTGYISYMCYPFAIGRLQSNSKTAAAICLLVHLLICFFILSFATSCVTTSAQKVQTDYLSHWQNRFDQYKIEFVKKDKLIREKDAQSATVMQQTSMQNPWAFLVPVVLELSVMTREAFTIAGRGETIKAFIQHMTTSPPPGLTEAWFQNQAEVLQKEAKQVDTMTEHFFREFDKKTREGPYWIKEIELLARVQGMVRGKADETKSLHNEAIGYYGDVQRAYAEDKYRAQQQMHTLQTLLGVAMYIDQLNYQQQLINTLNRPRTCSFVGNMMTCY